MLPQVLSSDAPSSIMPCETNRQFWLAYRQSLLMQIDAIEKLIGIMPTTADIRKQAKMPQAN